MYLKNVLVSSLMIEDSTSWYTRVRALKSTFKKMKKIAKKRNGNQKESKTSERKGEENGN